MTTAALTSRPWASARSRRTVAPRAEPDERARAGRAVQLYVLTSPLLWAGGLLIPVGGLLVLWLTAPVLGDVLRDRLTIAWVLVGLAQAVSVVVNGVGDERSGSFVLYRLVSTGVTGWIVLGLALGVGRRYRLASRRLVRSIAVLGAYYILFFLLALLVHFELGLRELSVLTLPGHFLPETAPAVKFSFTMKLFTREMLLGRELPRLVLFHPWAVVLGFAGVGVLFISALERRRAVRAAGMIGGLVAVIGSLGRAPLIGLVVAAAAYGLAHLRRRHVLLLVAAFVLSWTFLIALGVYPDDAVQRGYRAVSALRPGSSSARELVYAMNLAGFLDAPVLGQGWVGDYVAEGVPVPLGSHSSFSGLLYTGGAVTFGLFAVALLATVGVMARRAARGGRVQRAAFAITVALAFLAYSEALYGFVLSCLPILFFLGGSLADGPRPGARPAAPPRARAVRTLSARPLPSSRGSES